MNPSAIFQSTRKQGLMDEADSCREENKRHTVNTHEYEAIRKKELEFYPLTWTDFCKILRKSQ